MLGQHHRAQMRLAKERKALGHRINHGPSDIRLIWVERRHCHERA